LRSSAGQRRSAEELAAARAGFRANVAAEGSRGRARGEKADCKKGQAKMMRFLFGILAYVVPTFALGFVWHLVLFEDYYRALHIYRSDIIIAFGFASMLLQAVIFAWIYRQGFAWRPWGLLSRVAGYGLLGAALSWSFTTLAVAAKNLMTSVPDYLLIETGFTLVQWIMVAPFTVLAFGDGALPDRQRIEASHATIPPPA
jgi:hypothetical protein